eukprot:TRINITY_DN140030_c0_g1_i1.p3 TRINITY_DN140030_c0_g1~~TRINITY_DN140030_c0_g1_i1.p3  ORF type:complete len:109 (+),score=13.93 TRINITY_DN140030_c0_g1_i1:141-467(+)
MTIVQVAAGIASADIAYREKAALRSPFRRTDIWLRCPTVTAGSASADIAPRGTPASPLRRRKMPISIIRATTGTAIAPIGGAMADASFPEEERRVAAFRCSAEIRCRH